jgi:hypothetical protein
VELDAEAVNPRMTLEALAPLFTEEFEVAGCYLLPAPTSPRSGSARTASTSVPR